jgi:hypothetical protein
MKSVKDIIALNQLTTAQGLQQSQRPKPTAIPSSTNSGNSTEWVNTIFIKFSIFYGQIWRSQFKNEDYSRLARKEWALAIAIFDETLINEAIQDCLQRREFPPTLSQFIDCCKQLNFKNISTYRAPEVIKASPEVVLENLKQMKLILNMTTR